jgi:hypothetical protein
MYKSFIFLLLLLIVCLLDSCKSNNKTSGDKESITHINITQDVLSSPKAHDFRDVISEIIYIPLETEEYSLLKNINDIFMVGENILVSDYFSIHLFDSRGKYIKSISRKGQGPSDYFYVNTVIVDPVSSVFYLFTSTKIIKHTYEGVYLETIPKEKDAFTGLMTPERSILYYLPNRNVFKNDTSAIYSLIETDTLGNILKTYPNPEPRYAERIPNYLNNRSPLYIWNQKIYFNEFGNDTLFMLSGDSFIPQLVISLGDQKMDHNPDFSRFQTMEETRQYIITDMKLRIANIYTDENYYYIRLLHGLGGNGEDINCMYDKRTNNLIYLKNGELSNTLDGGIAFFPKKVFPDGTKVTWKDASDFREEILSKDYETQKAGYGERFEKVYQLALSLKEDDNPVLILTK